MVMDLMRSEYEFLDLSDVKAVDLEKLRLALYDDYTITTANSSGSWETQSLDLSTGSSNTSAPTSNVPAVAGPAGAVVVAGAGGEGAEMVTRPSAPPPPPYAPPPYAPPHQQWPVGPPNVYVSQVTANVNVHGYMGQYYQAQATGSHAAPQGAITSGGGGERGARHPRRNDRRTKRGPSPPPQAAVPPPYYVQYPQYYTSPQQGAPLYHLPLYQPIVYPHYYQHPHHAHPPYPYAEYAPEHVAPPPAPGPEGDKAPDEYPSELLMEQEAVEAYYAGTPYVPPYPPPEALEYAPPPVYMAPPPAALPPPPPHQHQFNVHAPNFVLNPKPYTPVPPPQSQVDKSAPVTVSATGGVESLPLKELKINKGPPSPRQTPATASAEVTVKPVTGDKFINTGKPDIASAKGSWLVNDNKPQELSTNTNQPTSNVKSFAPATVSANQSVGPAKVTPQILKVPKGPAAPFSGAKQPPKPLLSQASVPVPHSVSTSKAPFGNRQKRDGPNKSPSTDSSHETTEKSGPQPEQHRREPPLPASKAPMAVSITLQSQGPVLVSKVPFGHSRKAAAIAPPAEPVVAPPPPPAPTASDFPPPPTPRHRQEPPPGPGAPAATPAAAVPPAPGKSWASLFNKSGLGASAAPAAPVPTTAPAVLEEPVSPTAVSPPALQKPVAKVLPFDASPSQQAVPEKAGVAEKVGAPGPAPRPAPVPAPPPAAPALSYSEKTSVNAVSNVSSHVTPKPPSPSAAAAAAPQPEAKESPVQKEAPPPLPVQPSPFADDPNSYRMGEFLSKYQLDNRPVSLVPRGLTNRSNYCYVNAILQALIACPPFYNMLKALPYQTRRGKSSTPVIDAMVELCYEFSSVCVGGSVGAGGSRRGARGGAAAGAGGEGALPVHPAPPLDPAATQKVLRALRPQTHIHDNRQEDAEEFLSCLLNGLNDEMLELMKLVEPEEPKEPAAAQANGIEETADEPPEEEYDDVEWKVMGPRNRGAVERLWAARRTPLADLFRGRTRCRLHRAAHSRDPTDALQPFFTLQLDIERTSSVKDALELLAGKDTLEGVDAWQQLSLEQLPPVLLLHLKCFQLDAEGHTAKIVKTYEFPIDLKIDPKIMSGKTKYTSKQRMYKLFAVVYHEGVEATKGHYVTDTYHGQAGWIRYDDSTVTLVSDAQVLKPKPPRMPYLLMYRRADSLPIPHRPPIKTE